MLQTMTVGGLKKNMKNVRIIVIGLASSRVALGNRTRYDCELSDVYNEAYH